MNVVVKPVTGYIWTTLPQPDPYRVLRPGRGKINVCHRNYSAKQITLPKQTAVGEITAANVIPSLFALKLTEDE